MPADTTIGQLRLRASGRPDLAQRLRLESRLARLDLRPPSLPPSAILIVRSVTSRARADGTYDWNEIRTRIDAFSRQAAQPGRHPDANAPAVVFESEAELLACLALDVLAHVVTEHWWWRHVGVQRGSQPGTQLAAFMSKRPRCVPGAVKLLAATSSLAAVARLLTPEQSIEVLRAVEHAFWLPAAEAVAAVDGAGDGEDGARSAHVAEPPWRAWLPASAEADSLPPANRLLVGTALGLAVAPSMVSRPEYTRRASEWLALQQEPGARMPGHRAASGRATRATTPAKSVASAPFRVGKGTGHRTEEPDARRVSFAAVAGPPSPEQSLNPAPASARALPFPWDGENHEGTLATGQGRSGTTDWVPRAAGTPQRLAPQDAAATPTGRRPAPSSPNPVGRAAPQEVTEIASTIPDVMGVPTSLAGTFYLINLMLHLHLPGREQGPGISTALGPWGVLEALALGILDTLPEASATWPEWGRDPVWAQLGTLGDRAEGRPLGRGLARTRDYEVPAGWRAGNGAEDVLWSRRRGRVRRWSANGYLISDLPESSVPNGSQAMRRPASSAPLHRAGSEVSRRVAPAVQEWLARVVPYLRFRLPSAVGATAADADAALRALLLREGRLHVTSTHVDLVMALESVSGAVRKAGLDSDPGWQPLYGRVIKFHYV
jgi:hypothetical protein